MNKKGPETSTKKNLVLATAIALLLVASYWWRFLQLSNAFSYDQGIHLILAKLWSAGYMPYREIFVSYPPLFMWSMGVPWKIFNHPAALQLLMTTYALSGVLAVVYLGAAYRDRLAGFTAGLLLSFSPIYFFHSITVMGEVPSISVAVVAVALAEKYRRSGGWGWLVLAGGTAAASLSLKVLPFYVVPFLGLMVTARFVTMGDWETSRQSLLASRWRIFRDLVILGGSFSIVFLLPVFFFDLPSIYDQVVGMRLVSRVTEANPLESNNKDIIEFIFSQPLLTGLALYGLIFVIFANFKQYWLLLVWIVLIWVSMYAHVPLRGKHLPIFSPVLALYAGLGVSHIISVIKGLRYQPFSLQKTAMGLIIIILMAMLIFNVPPAVNANQSAGETEYLNEDQKRALEFIRAISLPTDCLLADDPVFLYFTDRLPPPELAEVSHTRIDTGYLTGEAIVQSLQENQCHVVALLTPRFGNIYGFTDWLEQNYLGWFAQGNTKVYFAQKSSSNLPAPAPEKTFKNLLYLDNVIYKKSSDQTLYVSLYWRLLSPLDQRYTAVITIFAGDGTKISQISRIPFEGNYDPAKWKVGQNVRDTFTLSLPPPVSDGAYTVYLAVCSSDDEECLSTAQGRPELNIGKIVVKNGAVTSPQN